MVKVDNDTLIAAGALGVAIFALVRGGPPGPAGADGADGRDGKPGKPGKDGRDGARGPAGPMGPLGPLGPAGPAGVPGPQGVAGPTGARGPAGARGPQGAPGPRGPAGTPASPIGPAYAPGDGQGAPLPSPRDAPMQGPPKEVWLAHKGQPRDSRLTYRRTNVGVQPTLPGFNLGDGLPFPAFPAGSLGGLVKALPKPAWRPALKLPWGG